MSRVQLPENLGQTFGCLRIEVGGGLIKNEGLRAESENRRQARFLLLAFGERVNVAREEILKSQEAHRAGETPVDLLGRKSPAFQRKGDLVLHAESKKLLFRILKERSRVFGEDRDGCACGIKPVDLHPPRKRSARNLRGNPVHERERESESRRGESRETGATQPSPAPWANRESATSPRLDGCRS